MARVVVVEAWYRGSHRAWADALAARSRHQVELVTHPGVHWRWRMQGGSLTLAAEAATAIDRLGGVDALVVTSACNLPALLAFLRRRVGSVPVLLYLHENQLTYPVDDPSERDLSYAMTTWLSMAAADLVVCNSAFHRDELFDALPVFLDQFPDLRHTSLVGAVAARTRVVPVGVDTERFSHRVPRRQPPTIIWNHRWEADKDPGRFVDAIGRLAATGRSFLVDVLGSHLPIDVVRRDIEPITSVVRHVGEVPISDYPAHLAAGDIVISTARQEFFGLAVAEAMAAGLVPVVPRALAYPELVPATVHEHCLYADDADLDRLLAALLDDSDLRESVSAAVGSAMRHVDVTGAVAAIDDLVDDLIA